jgi:D-alanine-D-alanine ligase
MDDRDLDAAIAPLPGDLRLPLIVKPAREDASVGISSASVVRDVDALRARVRHVLRHYRQPAIVEEFIEGREINVSVLARLPGDGDGSPQVLPLSEIDFSDMPSDRPRIVSFEGKWVEDSDEFHGTRPVPCELPAAIEARVRDLALRGFAAMQLRDYGRFDVRLAADGTPYVIDVNPNCDLSEHAGFARAARASGIAYDDLVLRIAHLALSRRPHADPIPLARRARPPSGRRRSPARWSSWGPCSIRLRATPTKRWCSATTGRPPRRSPTPASARRR